MAKVKLTNPLDIELARRGDITASEIRSVEVEALVDSGATMLVIPGSIATALGVRELRKVRTRYADGRTASVSIVGGIDLELPELGRGMTADAVVEPEGKQVLLGQMQLEQMDLVVDAKSREIRANPASPDVPLIDIFRTHVFADRSTPAA